MPKYSENPERIYFKNPNDRRDELGEKEQNQQHRLNRRCTIGASGSCRKNRRHCIGVIGRSYRAKLGKLSSTGLTDGSLRGIGAINILLSRDDVKCAAAKPSALEEPMPHRSKCRCNDVSKELSSATATRRSCTTGRTDAQASV